MGFEDTHLTIERYEQDERFVEYIFETKDRKGWSYGHLNNMFCLREIKEICAQTANFKFAQLINEKNQSMIKSLMGLN